MGKSKDPNNRVGIGRDVKDSVIVTGSGNTIHTGGSNNGSPKTKWTNGKP